MGSAPHYTLGHGIHATARLNLQNELTKTNLGGHLLDPQIDSSNSSMRIADVGCGTGAWLLQLAETLPSSVQFVGLDLSLAETPPSAWLPPNVSFAQFDIFKELGEDLKESFDVVNIQYTTAYVSDRTFDAVCACLIGLLKPGGYLQWTEADFEHWSWRSGVPGREPVEAIKTFNSVRHLAAGGDGTASWVSDLKARFEKAGLEEVRFQRPPPKLSTLQPMGLNWVMLMDEILGGMLARTGTEPFVGASQQLSRMSEEYRELKVGMDFAMTRCVGKKVVV